MSEEVKKQIEELSARFDVALNSYSAKAPFGEGSSPVNIVLNEYEKSVFLTKAQSEVFVNLYNGKNVYGDAFEITEEMRRYLDTLVVTTTCSEKTDITNKTLHANSKLYSLPSDLAFITLEQVTYASGKKDCDKNYKAKVYPVTQDEYATVKDNPFRGPTKYKVLRLDWGSNIVELIPADGYVIRQYLIKYLKKPSPIILTDLSGTGLTIEGESKPSASEFSYLFLNTILDRAVALALASKSIGIRNNTNSE